MKIRYDHQIFCTQQYGGFSKYFTSLARAFRPIAGVDAKVNAPAYINKYLGDDILGTLSFPMSCFQRGLNYRVRAMAPMFAMAARIEQPEVVHETHYILNGWHVPGNAVRVATCHDMIEELNVSPHPRQQAGVEAKRRAFERADAIICISQHTRNDLLNFYPHLADRTCVVHHGVSRAAPKNPHGLKLPAQFLLYVGMRSGYKNFARFINALALNKRLRTEFHLVCFGGGECTLEEKILLAQSGLKDNRVHFLTGDDAYLAHVYSLAGALVYPSTYEGFGMPLTEAMVQGCPIVTSRSSSLPEVCQNAAEYFDAENAEDMAAAIENVVFSGARRQELIDAGASRVSCFTWDHCARATLQAYERACLAKNPVARRLFH